MRYHFDGFTLIVDRRELLRGVDIVAVAPQVFDLIEYLVRHRERVVSKDELIDTLWGSRIISEAALTTRLHVARTAIADHGNEQRLIKTLPRKGFRFVGSVREEPGHASIPTSASACSDGSPGPTLGFDPRPSIVVLPFSQQSVDPNLEFLGDAIIEELLTELSKLHGLLLVARDPRLGPDRTAIDVRQLGRELGVRYVLEGNVRSARGRTRITGRLIDAATGVHIWGQRYDLDREPTSAFHDEIAQAIVSAIVPAICHADRQRSQHKRPEQLGAWEAYQRGVWHMSKSLAAENKLAQTLFQHAIDFDPNFGPGYGALAWTYFSASSAFSELTVAESCELGEPLVRKAIALDENDTDARSRLALTALLKGDIEGAILEAELILSVEPTNADAWGVKGASLVYAGRRKEGRDALKRYFSLNPRDIARPIRLTQIASSLYMDGGYEEAALTARQVIRHYPSHPFAYRWLAASLGQLGKAGEAQEVLQSLQTISPSSFEMYVRQRPPQFCGGEYAPMLEGLRKAGWKE